MHLVAHFLQGRPNVLEINILAVFAFAERFVGHVDIDAAGEREGDDQRRRHEEIGLDALMHARFEIAVAGQHRGGDEVVLADGFVDGCRQRTRIADAGGATVADEVETELIEIFLQAGFFEIIADDT